MMKFKVGDRVQSTLDGMLGTVTEVCATDDTVMFCKENNCCSPIVYKIQWDDGLLAPEGEGELKTITL